MSSEDRQLFLVPITVAGYLAALLVIAGLLAYDHWYLKKFANHIHLTVVITLALPILGWFAFRSAQVIRSIRRYNARAQSELR
jgi:hypothetical protein